MLYRIKSTHSSVKLRSALVGRIGIFHKLPKYSIDTWTDEPGITVGVSVEERKMDRVFTLMNFAMNFLPKKLASIKVTRGDELVELCSQKVINEMRWFIFRRYSLVLEDQV
jgi:hypothetical protein